MRYPLPTPAALALSLALSLLANVYSASAASSPLPAFKLSFQLTDLHGPGYRITLAYQKDAKGLPSARLSHSKWTGSREIVWPKLLPVLFLGHEIFERERILQTWPPQGPLPFQANRCNGKLQFALSTKDTRQEWTACPDLSEKDPRSLQVRRWLDYLQAEIRRSFEAPSL